MKKIFTPALLVALCLPAFAQEQLQILKTEYYLPERGDVPLVGLAISPDGKYIAGTMEQGMGIFIADRPTGKVEFTLLEDGDGGELRDVSNTGVGIGIENSGLLYYFDTNDFQYLPVPEDVRYVLGEGITGDGEMIVGTLFGDPLAGEMAASAVGAYKVSGTDWFPLPIPEDEYYKKFNVKQKLAYAKFVSSDGKVILGNIGNFEMPVIWVQNESGSYDVDFFLDRYLKSDVEGVDNTGKPLSSVSAMTGLCLSDNGRYAAMIGLINIGESDDPMDVINKNVVAVYDTKEKELKIYDQDQKIDPWGAGLIPSAIADDGTIVGTVGAHLTPYCSFYWKGGEAQAETFSDKFADYKKVLGEAEGYGNCCATAISADGQYIVGYAYYSEDLSIDSPAPAYYITYVIDVNAPASVKEIGSAAGEAKVTGYYDISGRRLDTPTKGINIIRMSDGTAQKVIVR